MKGKVKKDIDAFDRKPEREDKFEEEDKSEEGVSDSQCCYRSIPTYPTIKKKKKDPPILTNQLTISSHLHPNPKFIVALPNKLLTEICSRWNYRQVAFTINLPRSVGKCLS